jgi:hypothetical protein
MVPRNYTPYYCFVITNELYFAFNAVLCPFHLLLGSSQRHSEKGMAIDLKNRVILIFVRNSLTKKSGIIGLPTGAGQDSFLYGDRGLRIARSLS